MKYVFLLLIGVSIHSLAMERVNNPVIRSSDGSSEKDKSSSAYQKESSSSGAELNDVELGKSEPIKKSGSGIIIDNSGKRLSVKLEFGDLQELHQVKIDFSNPEDEEKLHKQMVKDLLRIVINDEEKYKNCKHAKPHIAKAIKNQLKSPKCDQIKNQLDCVRKISAEQLITNRVVAKRSPSPESTEVKRTPSPRDRYLEKSPHKNDEDLSELRDLVMQQLAEAGVSERNQKWIASAVGIIGTVGAPLVAWLITNYTKSNATCPTCAPQP